MLPQTHFKDFLKESIRQFEEQEHVKINVQVIPDNQWVNLIKTKVFTNETPDIVRIDKSVMMQIGTDRFVELDASEPWMERVIPGELESKLIDGKVYGLPVSSNSTIGIIYNKKLFSENGLTVPRSIDELWVTCQRFNERGIIPLYASDKDSWTTQTWFTSAAPQVAPDGTWAKLMTNRVHWSDIDEFTQVLNDMVALRANGVTNRDYMIATYTSAVDAMSSGLAAMYVSGHFFINDVLEKNPDIELEMAPMVYDDKLTVIESQGMFSIFQNSEHVDLAKAFLNWFSQAENMDVFTKGWGYTPIFNDQKVALPEWQEVLNRDYIRPGKVVPHVDSRLVGVDFVDFWGYQQELVVGDLTAEETLRKWDQAYAQQMKSRKMYGWVE
jgi:ABC-type glycerol-3-phosphate transport system substrate-binding protein